MKSVYATVQKEIKIQFYDLDPMDIVWHGNYVRFFEDARSELLNKIGYNYQEMKNSGYAWPVIDLHIRYIKSIKFKHKIIIQADLVEYEFRLKILYTIFEKNNKTCLCKGHTVQVAIDYKTKEMQFASPQILAHKLGQKI